MVLNQMGIENFVANYPRSQLGYTAQHYLEAFTDPRSHGGSKVTRKELAYANEKLFRIDGSVTPNLLGAFAAREVAYRSGVFGDEFARSASSDGGETVTATEKFVISYSQARALSNVSDAATYRKASLGELTMMRHIVELLGGKVKKFETTDFWIVKDPTVNSPYVEENHGSDVQVMVLPLDLYERDMANPSKKRFITPNRHRGNNGVLSLKQLFAHEATHMLQLAGIVEYDAAASVDNYDPRPELKQGNKPTELGVEDQAVWVESQVPND